MNTTSFKRRSGSGYAPANWREALAEIEDTRAELGRAGEYSDTPRYILDGLRQEADDKIGRLRPSVLQGVLAEYDGAIQAYQRTEQATRQAVAREISRWDPTAVLGHMNLYQEQVNQILASKAPDAGDQLATLYQEAKNSGDSVRLRAAGEVFKAMIEKVPGGAPLAVRTAAGHLERQAAADLQELRQSDDLRAARTAQQDAWQALVGTREELRQAGATLGEDPAYIYAGGDFARAYKRVAVVNGQPVIYSPDAPEVTGVYERGENEQYLE